MRTRRISSTTKKVIGVCFVALALVVALLLFRPTLQGGASVVFIPVWKIADGFGEGVFAIPNYFKSKSDLIEQNRKFLQDLSLSQIAVLDRNQLYEENLALKERMGRIAQPNSALASVILRPPEVPYDTLLIDIGSDADIEVGDKVAGQGTLLVGKVQEVYAHSARVVLFSSPGEKYNGFLRGSIPVEVQGQGGGSLVMQVPYDAQVKVGDLVTLPGIESNTTSVVEHIKPGQGDSAVTAYLRLPLNQHELRFVDVWRSAK